jgi:PIN domain nuclease of toxin-antitoxin system
VADHLADTHALFWFFTNSSRLGPATLQAMRAAMSGQGFLIVPSIVMAELYYLNIKLGRPLDYANVYQAMVASGRFRFVDFRAADVLQFDALAAVSEMHDRIIIGVARALGVPCLTCDAAIVNSGLVQTIW